MTKAGDELLRPGLLRSAALIAALLAAGCQTTAGGGSTSGSGARTPPVPLARGMDPGADLDPFPSTYRPLPSRPTAIVHATVLDGTGRQIDDGVVVMAEGRITAVGGPATAIPAGVTVVDARGQWVTPGVIDAHSHLGVYPSPAVPALSDGNELTDPNTAQVWSEHSVWPQDPGFNRAREGGVTTLQILPGSGNLFGGRSVTLRNVPAATMQGMKFPGAPYGLKMACGENPSRVYGSRQRFPSTGMGNVAGYRAAWIRAAAYARSWRVYRERIARNETADPPTRDLQLDTLAGVLDGTVTIQNHCYRADEMAVMIDIAHEFGFRINMFHHASEAYKIAPLLAREHICAAIWGDWWGFKMEAYDGVEENAALLQQAGACVVIHSDDENGIQRLNQASAIALGAAARAGITITAAQAIQWITLNPARAIGVDHETGSLEVGKRADVVIWDHNPFSVYALTRQVYIDGAVVYDRADPLTHARSDFELGQPGVAQSGGRR